ncbi:MAG: hypothetical protein GY903_08070 [Fuerstiella sp.]|nr:hypothetical protein [Fuerstiella sp.]MCP4854435.1 hypothetical protein [Fuerstiella sp.]
MSGLSQMGIAAMVVLDDLIAAARRNENDSIHDELQQLIGRLKTYDEMREKVTQKRRLLQHPDSTTRQAAAFWLGHLGELAAPALPDLEAMLTDPVNEDIAINVKAAIDRIRHALHVYKTTST